MPKYNILYLHSHDTGRYIQPYGYAVPTPNLQKFAEQGVLFQDMHCAAPTCSPSRASFLTGQWAHCNGMLGLAHRGSRLHNYGHLLSHVLANTGYETVLSGIQHIAKEPFASTSELGYQQILTESGDDYIRAQDAVTYLQQRPSQPFFLDIGFIRTHRIGDGFVDADDKRPNPNYVRPPATITNTTQNRSDMADFMASAHQLDGLMGQVLDALEESGQAENTLVICTTDHGIAFPGMKCNLTQHGTGVMLMMRGPGGFEGGRVIDSLTSQIDIFPTLCEVLDIPGPDWLQGMSLMPLIRQECQEINDAVFAEVSYHAAYEPQRSVRTTRYNYIRRFGERKTPVMPNIDNSPSKTFLTEHDYGESVEPTEVLFDTLFDPNETHNLANDPNYIQVLIAMQQRLQDWMKDTNDPLLKGDVPLPENGITTDPNSYNPDG